MARKTSKARKHNANRPAPYAQPLPQTARAGETAAAARKADSDAIITLRHELALTKESLQAIIEEQEATNEELRSANEEIQSSNEELSKVNEALEHRNRQWSQANDDMHNLLASVNLPIVMVGNDLRIRHFTPRAEKVLNLIPADAGRPISNIQPNVNVPRLESLFTEVMETLRSYEGEVRDFDGRWYSLRIRPYKTEENKIEGAVMVLVDIDPLKQSEEALRQAHEDLEARVRQRTAELEATGESLKAQIAERERIQRALQHSETALLRNREELRALTASLLTAHEDERRRLSRELHDALNQNLALLEIDVERLEQELPASPDQIRKQLESLRGRVGELSNEIRRMAHQLHPSILDDLGLPVALRSYTAELARHEGMEIRFRHKNVPEALPQGVALCLYRVAQEALRNVIKHAGARRATVSLESADGGIQLSIRDYGVGFEPEAVKSKSGLGLVSMEERVRLVNGWLEIKSRPGQGTLVKVRVPLPESSSAEKKP